MAFRLPPLSSLRLFEAAARHQSFKRAAEELHITPSAVSHGVNGLEDWLGAELFHRGVRGLVLTPAGAAYAEAVTQALTIMALATERVPGRAPTGTLSVSSAPTFANRWLLPRLSRFRSAYPDIRVSIDTAHRQIEFPLDGKDLAIRLAPRETADKGWTHLVQEHLFPVCAPTVLASMQGEDIFSRVPLIHVTSISEDWDAWFAAAGIRTPGAESGLHVDTVQMAFEAAAQGLGIALGRSPLVDDDVAQGRLVRATGPVVASNLGYWLVGAEGSFDRPETKAFRRWLLGELGPKAESRAGTVRIINSKPVTGRIAPRADKAGRPRASATGSRKPRGP